MDLCKLALFLLLAAFVFYLVVSLCCGKEKFCPGSTVVRNNRSGYYPGVGRSIPGQSDCAAPPQQKDGYGSYVKRYGCPNYVIEGMDSPEKVAQFVAKKALENELKYRNPCTHPDNKYPAGNPMARAQGGSNDGRMAITGRQMLEYEDSLDAQHELQDIENLAQGQNFYEGFEDMPSRGGNDKEGYANDDLTAPVAPCTTDACGLPETMFNDKCGDPNTYVYDRQISVASRSRTYGQGNYLLGDLPICPAVFRDSYGHQVFTPSARPEADLNAGAMRFISGDEVSLVNISGDVQAYRDCGQNSNVGVQYSLAG